MEHEAGRGGGDAGERVQERDHDRHVRAADRQHEEDAERERAEDDQDEQELLLRAEDDHEPDRDERGEQRHVPDLLAGIGDRPAADQLAQLREGDHAAGERDAADQRREDDRDRGRCSRAGPAAGSELWKSASATSAAAPPPTPLNSATISGIAVIFTARAAYAPIGAGDRHHDQDRRVVRQVRA